MKSFISEIIYSIIHIKKVWIVLSFMFGVAFTIAGVYRIFDYLKYPQIPKEQLEEKSGLLESCKIIHYRADEYLYVKLQDGSYYKIIGNYYRSQNWKFFIESCQRGDKMRLLVRSGEENIYEMERNGEKVLSYEESCKIREEMIKEDMPAARVLFLFGCLLIFISTVLFIIRKFFASGEIISS